MSRYNVVRWDLEIPHFKRLSKTNVILGFGNKKKNILMHKNAKRWLTVTTHLSFDPCSRCCAIPVPYCIT